MSRMAWLSATILFLATHAEGSSLYTITDLGTLPGTNNSIATGLNDSGQVVGYATTATGPLSFLYSNGQMTQINYPVSGRVAGGITDAGQILAQGQFINSSGQVVASYQPFQAPVTTTVNGVTTTQTTFIPAGINDAGQIAVTTGDYAGVFQNGRFFNIGQALGLTNDVTQALGINNAGTVLLSDFHPATDSATYLLYKANGTSQILNMNGSVLALNNLGQVVGNGELGANGTGVLYSNGQYLSLPTLLPPSSQSLWQGLDPVAINDEGQIVGTGTIDGQFHAFLMTPTATPEPSTLAILATAIAAFSVREWARRRRQR